MTHHSPKKSFMTGKGWLVFLMALGSAYGIFIGITDLIKSQSERESKQRWHESEKQILVSNCIRDSKDNAIKYADQTRKYCDCSIDKIMSKFTKNEYIDVIEKSIEDQKIILLPIFQNCLTEYQKEINEGNGNEESPK